MTRDDIISMAREAGCGWTRNGTEPLLTGEEQIQRFADLVAIKVAASEREWMQETNIKLIAEAVSAEREACAALCKRFANRMMSAEECADAIRDRGVK